MRVSNIDAVAPNGPPDDFNNQPTQFGNWGRGAQPPQGEPPATVERPGPAAGASPGDDWPPFADPLDESEPTPWYRKPAALIGWIAAVLILLALIVYGVLELIHGGQGTSHTPSTSTTPSTTISTSTTPPPTTTTTTEPPTSSVVEPPAPQPTWTPSRQPTRQPTQQPPTHRHHLPSLPPEITIPDGPVITLPPGLS